jgi:hypothetical protein
MKNRDNSSKPNSGIRLTPRGKALAMLTPIIVAAAVASSQAKNNNHEPANAGKNVPTQEELAKMTHYQITLPQEQAVDGVDAVLREVPNDAAILDNEWRGGTYAGTAEALRQSVVLQTDGQDGIVHADETFQVADVEMDIPKDDGATQVVPTR